VKPALEFCPSCKCVLLEDRKKKVLLCRKCGFQKPLGSSESQRFVESIEKPRETVIVKDTTKGDDRTLPITKAECPKCGNTKAYYWMMQTRSADEASTRFYQCTKCKHTWREYE
jgi:DNA-directed RNA polymerase subunit M